MFDTPSLVNDFRVPIYVEDDITVLYASSWEYIEIFGISDEEFERGERILVSVRFRKEII